MSLPVLSGHADAVRALARSLTASASRIAEVATVLRALRGDAVWDDAAGEAFGARLAGTAGVLDRVIDRYAGAAAAIRLLAPVLEESQSVVVASVRADDAARGRYAALESAVTASIASGAGEEDAQVRGLRRLQQEQVVIQQRAGTDHARAWARFEEADRRCASVLRALADDALADPLLYRGLRAATTTSSHVATIAGWAGPEGAPVAATAGIVSTLGGTALLVGYGEGSWSSVLSEAGWSAAGFGGSTLRAGAGAGARKVNGRFVAGKPLSGRRRLATGARSAAVARREAIHASLVGAPTRGTPTALTGVLARRTPREQAVAFIDSKWRDGWRKASANGPLGQRMYVAGVTLEAAGKVGPRIHGRGDLSSGA